MGGGTDYPVWYEKHKGAVLSTSIDKYCYISCRHLPPFFNYLHRIVYSKIECVKKVSEIKHPSVRETFRFMDISEGIGIHHDGDLPARAGLGTSSAFTVGLLNALYALKGEMIPKRRLALEAIHIEQDLIKENVGSQDQIAAAFGGFNRIEFFNYNNFVIKPVTIKKEKLELLEKHLMLFFTGFSREASLIAGQQIKETPHHVDQLSRMYEMVDEALGILNQGDLTDFGRLLNEAWILKRSLTGKITTPEIDAIYNRARNAGVLGGKLLGAGGGGFILFFVEPERQKNVRKVLKDLLYVPFKFEDLGSQIIYYEEE